MVPILSNCLLRRLCISSCPFALSEICSCKRLPHAIPAVAERERDVAEADAKGHMCACAGAAERLPSSSSVGGAEGSASIAIPKIGKPKKRVSWRAGSLDDVAQASSSHAGLATAAEMAQEQRERFTWKVSSISFSW